MECSAVYGSLIFTCITGVLILYRLEWRSPCRCMLDCNLALVCAYGEHLRFEHADYNRPVCRIRCLLVPFHAVPLVETREVQDSVFGGVHLVWDWNDIMDDMGFGDCKRRWSTLEFRSTCSFWFNIRHLVVDYGWDQPEHWSNSCRDHQRIRLFALFPSSQTLHPRYGGQLCDNGRSCLTYRTCHSVRVAYLTFMNHALT